MLNSTAFATSLATISGALYLLLYVLAVVWPDASRFLFNAPLCVGADAASLLPRELSYAGLVGTLVVIVAGVWVFAFAWAWVYNRLARVQGSSSG